MQATRQDEAEEKQKEQEAITAEYLRRRTRERIYYLGFFAGLTIACSVLTIGLFQGWLTKGMDCIWQIVFIALAAGFLFLSWRNWRCPACDAWLAGVGFQINALWPPTNVHCPRCGTKLQ